MHTDKHPHIVTHAHMYTLLHEHEPPHSFTGTFCLVAIMKVESKELN